MQCAGVPLTVITGFEAETSLLRAKSVARAIPHSQPSRSKAEMHLVAKNVKSGKPCLPMAVKHPGKLMLYKMAIIIYETILGRRKTSINRSSLFYREQ